MCGQRSNFIILEVFSNMIPWFCRGEERGEGKHIHIHAFAKSEEVDFVIFQDSASEPQRRNVYFGHL